MAQLQPDFGPDFSKGLVPAIAQDAATGEVLMLAYMNEEAWKRTLETGEAHYWSRSRQGTLAQGRHVRERTESAFHPPGLRQRHRTAQDRADRRRGLPYGRRSCFYREWDNGVVRECSPVVFDPRKVYGTK